MRCVGGVTAGDGVVDGLDDDGDDDDDDDAVEYSFSLAMCRFRSLIIPECDTKGAHIGVDLA